MNVIGRVRAALGEHEDPRERRARHVADLSKTAQANAHDAANAWWAHVRRADRLAQGRKTR